MERRNLSELVKIIAVAAILLILLGGALILRQSLSPKKEAGQLPAGQLPRPTSTAQITSVPTASEGGMMAGESVGLGLTSPTLFPTIGKYMLTPSNNKVKVDQTFDLSTIFSAPGKILDGSDVFIRFDPVFLEASSIVEGDYFSTYPRKQIDNKTGTIKITGIRSTNETPLSKTVTFSSISFKAKKTGTTKVTFEFKNGKTNRTTLVEKGTSRNILGNVFPANISIEQ